MLEAGAEIGGEDGTKRCFFCDNPWKIVKKLSSLSRWGWRPRTWINCAVILVLVLNVVSGDSEESGHYTPQWAVHIEGGQEVADEIAAKHGFVNLGAIFEDLYHFEHKRLQKRSLTPHSEYHSNLLSEVQVKWAQQQVIKKRSKRDVVPLRPRSKSNTVRFNDVEWSQMWYLNRGQGLDMNVQGAWLEGISGKGVVVTILDDGLEKNHPDLVANYDPQASYDVNNHDQDPMPRYDPLDSNRHGTRCAGEVAAVANNSLCSVGVAFGANVGGVRMLDGDVTDAVEARSLSLNPQHIDIYSASWGPDDDGKTVDGPGELATRAFIEGVTKGRQGKGSIFVWASGNGGREHDNCNCDGYTNSIWTLSISSATENGFVPWYSEACSSTLATTYSSGGVREKQIVTTDLRHKCTNGHTGTSASAPLAAGICALALEANRDLTWRDMQHIVVRTARPANLKSSDWKVNGVGRNVSHSFGYGLMDATAMVRLARTWKTVPEQHRCEVSAPHVDKLIPARSKVILNLNVTECTGVNFLEHVQAKISLSSSRRGDLQIYLTSPAGTRSTLLARRPQDSSRNPFSAWPFMSVHTWGEMPFGIWQLEIHNEGRYLGRANLQEWSLLFYGTSQIPTEMPVAQPSPKFSSKSSSNKSNSMSLNFKPNKNSSATPNYLNRKNYKNWKVKSTPSRVGKLSNVGTFSNGTKTEAVVPFLKNFKTTQKSKWKDLSPRSTSVPPSTHSLPLTIVLGPSGNQKVPDVFQKYPKVQQLFPVYVNTGRMYEDNFLIPKIELASSKSQEYLTKSKSGSYLGLQKAERQNRFDTSSLALMRTSTEGKLQNKKTPFQNQQNQGHFEGWQMIFFGTEESPYGEIFPGHEVSNKGKNGYVSKGIVESDISNHLEGDIASRGGWKDQATRRDDVTRTTTDPLGNPSSGCASISVSTSQCIGRGSRAYEELRGIAPRPGVQWGPLLSSSSASLVLGISLLLTCPYLFVIECISGLYLYAGRCESNCPPKTYPGINAKERAACMPCHYTCLTCAGESEGHCTSCHDEAVPTPSGIKDTNGFKTSKESDKLFSSNEDSKTDVKVEDLPVISDDSSRLSWGKRQVWSLVNKLVLSKKAVTKKILEPYNAPQIFFFCYPASLMREINSNNWYHRMSLLFAVNLFILLGIISYTVYRRFCRRKGNTAEIDNLKYRYFKYVSNGDSLNLRNNENILHISSSSEEE